MLSTLALAAASQGLASGPALDTDDRHRIVLRIPQRQDVSPRDGDIRRAATDVGGTAVVALMPQVMAVANPFRMSITVMTLGASIANIPSRRLQSTPVCGADGLRKLCACSHVHSLLTPGPNSKANERGGIGLHVMEPNYISRGDCDCMSRIAARVCRINGSRGKRTR